MLEQCCNHSKQCCDAVLRQNRRCESFCVTSPLRCSRAKQRQRNVQNVQKKCAARAKLLSGLLDLLVVYTLRHRRHAGGR